MNLELFALWDLRNYPLWRNDMKIDFDEARKYLVGHEFKKLFYEQLGWDKFDQKLDVIISGQPYQLKGVAEKRGFVCFICLYPTNSVLQMKIDNEVTKNFREHIIIYTEIGSSSQTWQWVRREPGKPIANRSYIFHNNQSGHSLLQRLENLAVSYDMEGSTTISDITSSVQNAFDSEKVTKKFYDKFTQEHKSFQKHVQGIEDKASLEWYTSLTLNRLMFVYFIQKKGFLDGNTDYLNDRLQQVKKNRGDNHFITFYRYFLLHLFHDGLGKSVEQRNLEPYLIKLLGKVPYLNGGYFEKHQIEIDNPRIDISDDAFSDIFSFFDQYQWHLDTRPLHDDNEINPDVIGYIFEKYINQKQMGAYYTKEDITEYISKNTILPFVLSKIKTNFPALFTSGGIFLELLKANPIKYMYSSNYSGIANSNYDIPKLIESGVTDCKNRSGWNQIADSPLALYNETWREYFQRKNNYISLKDRIKYMDSLEIPDMITWNLDIWQLIRDVIGHTEDSKVLMQIWRSLNEISILDPTCGSGAFLFAALTILESLYIDCIEQIEYLLEIKSENQEDLTIIQFRMLMENITKHPNTRYFVLKTIVLNNLYGVDIMEEAVEICKLRFFLKLIAQIDDFVQIEPLPDIDFNIRPGNTLIGFSTLEQVLDSQKESLVFNNDLFERFVKETEEINQMFTLFRDNQTLSVGFSKQDNQQLKSLLNLKLKNLCEELNHYLAESYTIYEYEKDYHVRFEKWKCSHLPFHWFVEFYKIMKSGGFDVVIGNPPYVEYSEVKKSYKINGYRTESCGNLYAYVLERSLSLTHQGSRLGMIVQLPIVCTDRMSPLQDEVLTKNSDIWISTYDDRPGRLFDGLEHIRATIVLSVVGDNHLNTYTTKYNRWTSNERELLFNNLHYILNDSWDYSGAIPKIGDNFDLLIYNKIKKFQKYNFPKVSQERIFYHNAPQYWIRAMTFAPYFWNEKDGEKISTQNKNLYFFDSVAAKVICSILNSSLFYWWFILLSDCRHLNSREIVRFPYGINRMNEEIKIELARLCDLLMDDYRRYANRKECNYKSTGRVIYDEFYPRKSKNIIDEIDRILGKHYGLSNEELDYIINFDIKFRLGDTDVDEEE
jgi:hypothetical protein